MSFPLRTQILPRDFSAAYIKFNDNNLAWANLCCDSDAHACKVFNAQCQNKDDCRVAAIFRDNNSTIPVMPCLGGE